ncbi:CHAT domain-containing protein [Pantanalinema sp. GBBB05]|uniref:CHAT domain-containing protein n=1 Tax=Pantanalinema sp. GBBB05 TaxID=2604139 RepID=UPI003D816511
MQDRKVEGDRLLQVGMQQYQIRQFEAALSSWQQALQIYRDIKDRYGEGNALSNLGLAYYFLDDYDKMVAYHQQALVISRETKDRHSEGTLLNYLGSAYQSLGDYSKAIEYYEQSLAIAQEIKDRQGEGDALSNLGLVYKNLANYGKAIEYYKQSLAIAQEIKNRKRQGDNLGKLGSVYGALGDAARAIKYHEQSLAIARAIKDRQGEGIALSNLGNVYYELSNYRIAIEYHQQSLAITREIKDRWGEKVALANLGSIHDALGRYSKAIEYYQQSLIIAREIKDRQSEGNILNNLGLALFNSGNLALAEKVLFDSILVLEAIRQRVGSNDTNKVSIFELQAVAYRTLQQVLIAQKKTNAALEIAEEGRARAFVELLTQRLADRNQLSAANLPTTAPLALQQIQQIAKVENATLVQYSILFNEFKIQGKQEWRESEIYIWVIPPTGEITFRKADLKSLWQQQNSSLVDVVVQSRMAMGARGRADVEVTLSPEFLKQQQEQQTRNLKQLHGLLIQPIADLLPRDPNQHVIFIPQYELFLVPFPALLDVNNKSLIEQHTILTAPSIQVLELTRQQRQAIQTSTANIQNALVVGNPVMPKVVTQVGKTPVQLSDLPGAKREALAIAGLLKTKAITGAEATESAIAQQMPQARIIHLATHGLLDDTKGLGVPGAIALAPVGNNQLNDGLLTSDEILDMKLNAELVVLSACDTGRGEITGDGVIGLSRSLITAGVPSIVVSLWKVPDDSTAFLMTEFYKNLSTTNDKAQALRQAMLAAKQKYSDPLHWAAFTLIGEAE